MIYIPVVLPYFDNDMFRFLKIFKYASKGYQMKICCSNQPPLIQRLFEYLNATRNNLGFSIFYDFLHALLPSFTLHNIDRLVNI